MKTEHERHIKRLLSLAEAVREAAKRLPDAPVSAEVVACAGIMGMANWLEDVAALLRSEPVEEPVLWRWRETTGGRLGKWETTDCEPWFSTTGHSAGRTWEKQALVPAPPAAPEAQEPPEDDWDNEDYVRGWQDAKADSVDPRSKRPCPGCARGDTPMMLDEDGTLCSVSGRPGRLGHGVDDRFCFCADYSAPEAQEPVGHLIPTWDNIQPLPPPVEQGASPSGTPTVCRESGTPERAPGGGGEPTPEALEAWAEWFDGQPDLQRYLGPLQLCTPGYLLREIARRLRAAREE
ncbi:MAG TPA: hypothetical protein VNA25_22670 [Phycisphaerae bacterium]|nr:hypothetical protein [Phycisphaerae bacterium]